MSNYKLTKIIVAYIILLIIFLQIALMSYIVAAETKASLAKKEELVEVTEVVASTPTPSPTPVPRVTLPIFEKNWFIEYDESIPTWEKEEIALQCDNLITSISSVQYSNSEEAVDEVIRLTAIRDLYMADVEVWQAKIEEYPIACEIWVYLTEGQGMSDVQAAAIIGNMMVESGGHSLYIDPYAYSPGFYGVCQWSTSYHYRVNGCDLYEQLDYLIETLEEEFQYGSASYSQFINATTPEDASVYFALGYERCADPYNRQYCARQAYDYFCA